MDAFAAADEALTRSILGEDITYDGTPIRALISMPSEVQSGFGALYAGGLVIDVLESDIETPAAGDTVFARGQAMVVVGEPRQMGGMWRMSIR